MAEVQFPAGVDPTDPALIERMKQQARKIEAENAPPETLVELDDLTDTETLAGRPCRPVSAAMFALLEAIGSPLASASDNAPEIKSSDMITALYMLCAPVSDDELVELVRAGTVEDAAMAWGLRISAPEFHRMCAELMAKFNAINQQGIIYTGDDPGDQDPKKKAVSLGIG